MSLLKETDDLDEVKAEVKMLREECRVKTELSYGLRKSHADQIVKIQQVNMEIEKLSGELNFKSEEICDIRRMYDELQSSLRRKDLFVEQIGSANESLRVEYGDKILKLDEANSRLVSDLDEASARIQDLERKTCASDEEIARLKRFISEKLKKELQLQNSDPKDLKERDLYIFKLEEEARIVKEQLKWKDEQFSHLEEALDKLQTCFQMNKVEWQKEKSALVDEISSVQAALDAQMRVSQSLETQLRMCNQALVHEETRRKFLELESSEFRSRHDNVYMECQGVTSEIEHLTMKKDEEIAELRSLLRKKDIILTEMRHKTAELEQENCRVRARHNILISMKDHQQTELNDSAASCSSENLTKELHSLKRVHNTYAANMKMEDECNLQIEKLKGDLRSCSSELDGKNGRIKEACAELEVAKYLFNEENFVLIMVLTSEFNVAYSKLQIANENLETSNKQIEETNVLLEQQLEIKTTELLKVYDELKRHEMLENAHREHKIKDFDALEMAKVELADKASEVEKYKLESMKWKTDVEHLKLNLEESQQLRQQEKENLVILKDQNAKNSELHEQVCDLEALLVEKMKVTEILKLEKDAYMQIAEEGKCSTESLKNELARNEARYLDLLNAHKNLEQEMVKLLENIDEKDRKAQELNKQVETLDHNLKSATISFAEKESLLDESLNRAKDQYMLQIEEKNQIILNLEKYVNDLCKNLDFQEKTATHLKQEVLHLEASLKAKNTEIENFKSQFEKERKKSEDMLDELKAQKEALLEDFNKASNDREYLLLQLDSISARFELFCKDDIELMDLMKKMLSLTEEGTEPAMISWLNNINFSTSRKYAQVSVDERTPLTELNC